MSYTVEARIPFPREEWARICLETLLVDTELREDLVHRAYAVEEGAVFVARFRLALPLLVPCV